MNIDYCRHSRRRRYLYTLCFLLVGYVFLTFHADRLLFRKSQFRGINNEVHYVLVAPKALNVSEVKSTDSFELKLLPPSAMESLHSSEISNVYSYEHFTKWNRSLCSNESDRRGPHQKVISISIYGSTSKYTDNSMFNWDKSILPFLIPLAAEVQTLLPSWIIRLYIDYAGSSKSQQASLSNFSNVDLCDIHNIPLFGSSLLMYLPGKMWRFLPVFDPFVDFFLSRDLDSPIMKRETETIELWESSEERKSIFHIARDHKQHDIAILGGLWGAAPIRARHYLFHTFRPMLAPSIARRYNGSGDQRFLSEIIWRNVKAHSLIFDSYSCKTFGGRPFLSQRPLSTTNCFLGCIRPCCLNITSAAFDAKYFICPEICRPKDHQDWIYC
ncbi:unnamed protein product [Rotaria magnacalcarata]|uniref:Uncharacterized protein n=1 Tax=Rotaria magnacalcarata TaxID=392030 RepID=A0A817A1X8_9BILA|nr:unnamed protein product [Rotaria magnacalcarata]CAF1655920.1 unnamed protein product [Rotaria magnacalcarata]CAF2108498.1 unnamed protein product [Rotaria magnacalcarata]CAF2183604.1 unnamed protein product [Rotaria magnacalcarata]CAF2225973.1 unnamed protein product [Rotaria magnacalcarata]